ncbi:MAG TPA: YsnF/AvaK domain-containing protein, partial [Propionibacteriaceae bacterium]|nr:YsnF/AvaK domain-containing protein [Propionibacteriaceae bacterium]
SNVQVNYDKATVKDAPRVDADGALSPEEEETLYSYYGLSGGHTAGRDYDNDNVTTDRDHDTTSGFVGGGDDGDRDKDGDKDAGLIDRAKAKLGGRDNDRDNDNDRDFSSDRDTVGHDTSGPTTDDAMTLSEERVNVGVQRREAGRARLRKYVVTENVTQTVPVSREEVRVEREPITDANIGNATSGPAISEEEHEVVLHEERPVVQKEAVPVERVRLDTETVTENVTVNEEVRKEQVDTDLDGDNNLGNDRTAR